MESGNALSRETLARVMRQAARKLKLGDTPLFLFGGDTPPAELYPLADEVDHGTVAGRAFLALQKESYGEAGANPAAFAARFERQLGELAQQPAPPESPPAKDALRRDKLAVALRRAARRLRVNEKALPFFGAAFNGAAVSPDRLARELEYNTIAAQAFLRAQEAARALTRQSAKEHLAGIENRLAYLARLTPA